MSTTRIKEVIKTDGESSGSEHANKYLWPSEIGTYNYIRKFLRKHVLGLIVLNVGAMYGLYLTFTEAKWFTVLSANIQQNTSISVLLMAILCLTFVAFIGKFHWNRRKLYKAAAKLKGPPTLPLVGNALLFMGDMTKVLQNIIKIVSDYPDDIFRIWIGSKLFLGIVKPEHLEIVLQSPHCLGKDDDVYKHITVFTGTALLGAPVPVWKKNRKLISPAFNQKILDSFMDIFNAQIRVFLRNLESNTGRKDMDINNLVSRMTLDSLYESTMGVKLESQINPTGLIQWMNTSMEITFIRMVDLWYRFDFIFNMSKMSNILYDSISRMNEFTHKVVHERTQQFQENMEKLKKGEEVVEDEHTKKKTLLNLLLQLTYEGSKMTTEELRQEVNMFTIAGTDTTASNLSFCFTMLGMHQEIQEKIRIEILDILGEDRDVNPEDLSRLNLLERFIKETLRLFPTGPLVLRVADKDLDLGEHQIPAGCSMVLPIIGIHRNPNTWKDPLKFDPDRFLPEEIAKRHPYSFIPFSGGPRNCIGYKYAMMSMKTTLAMVLRKFVVKTEYKTIEEIRLRINLVLKPTDGYKVSVLLRE